jgi:general secretion pathway protein D
MMNKLSINHSVAFFRGGIKFLCLGWGMLLIASCANLDDETAPVESEALPVAEQASSDESELSTSVGELASSQKEEERRSNVVYKGTDSFVKMPAKEEPVRFVGEAVSLNFEQAPLGEVTHAIMGDILGLDYLVDRPVQGTVTLRTRTPVPRDQLLQVLESLLKANNTIMIRDDSGRYLITGSAQGGKLSPRVSNPMDSSAGYSIIIVPLKYIGAAEMAEILKPVAEESAFVRIDSMRNLLMLAGTREQLDGWQDMITTFDVDQLAGMSVGLFPLTNSSVNEAMAALNALIASAGGSGPLIRVIPIDRLNSILVVTPRSEYLDKAAKWIERLDEAHYSALDRRLYIFPVQNTTAKRLAELLNSIYSGNAAGSRQGSGSRNAGGVAPGMSPETIGSGSSSSTRSSAGLDSVEMGGSGDGPGGSLLEGVRVVADEDNNSLMIYSTALQFRVIEDALEQLDVVATQVIIEASIMEVSLTDDLSYGLEWTFKNGLGSDYSGEGFLSSLEGVSEPASIVPGFSYTVTNSIGDVSAVLNALAKESLLNIISTPSVMVLDNHSAYIHVGQQVPIIEQQTSSLASDTDRVTQSITYRDTGVKLEVTPSVNAGGLVTMDVSQSVTDVGDIDAATGQRAFLERNIVSRVAVRSNESVVLGGLIRENVATASQGVPWLHSIPLVGSLFGTDTETDQRTELLVIITPRAIYNESELREVSAEMRSRLRNLDLISPL